LCFKLAGEAFEIYDIIEKRQTGLYLLYDILLAVGTLSSLIGYYHLSQRSLRASTYFNAVQTVITTVFLLEKEMMNSDKE